jgi:hypothetical protein
MLTNVLQTLRIYNEQSRMYIACIEETDRIHCNYLGSITDVLRMHSARVAETAVVLSTRGISVAVIKEARAF